MEIVLYYSLTGTCKKYTENNYSQCLNIAPVKPIPTSRIKSFIWYFINSKKNIEYQKLDIDWKQIDKLTIITPIWAGVPALPVKSFINNNIENLQTIDMKVIAISGGGVSSTNKKLNTLIPKLEVIDIANKDV